MQTMGTIMIRLDDETEARLIALAEKTGRTKTFYVREALLEKLEEYEDYFVAKDALEEFRQSNDAAIPWDEVEWPEE